MEELERRGALLALHSEMQQNQPAPQYVLRGHEAQINSVAFGTSQDILVSGDADGFVSVWSLQTFRPVATFKAHAAGVLATVCWNHDQRLLTHGRDNFVHVYDLATILAVEVQADNPSSPTISNITPLYSLEVNALGFCRCSLLALEGEKALVAVPSTLEDTFVDVFHLPSRKRVYRSVGKTKEPAKTGTVMSIAFIPGRTKVQLFTGYESGQVRLFEIPENLLATGVDSPNIREGDGWTESFTLQGHKEPIMANCVDLINRNAWTVGADHMVSRYSLEVDPASALRAYKTAHPGRGSIAVRSDGRILATGGWDGDVRVHSAKSFKPLAVLQYHKDSVYTLAFGGEARPSWLAAAGADQRISLWQVFQESYSSANQ